MRRHLLFNDTATTKIYTLSLHGALPICNQALLHRQLSLLDTMERRVEEPEILEDLFRLDHLTTRMRRHAESLVILSDSRSEEHTSELQSRQYLVCRLLLEKKTTSSSRTT